MANPITHFGQYVQKNPHLISPIARKFKKNPLETIDLKSAQLTVLKGIAGTVVFAINDFVVKWTNHASSKHELKLHSDDIHDLPFALPLLYGKNDVNFTLPTLFGRVLRFDKCANGFESDEDKVFFESLMCSINVTAEKNIINSTYHLMGTETQCVIITPRCDNDLNWLIPQLKKRNLNQIVADILTFVKKAAEQLVLFNLFHGDLRARNVYWTATNDTDKCIITLFLADFGETKRLSDNGKYYDEYAPFERSITTMREARREEEPRTKKLNWNALAIGEKSHLMTELPTSPEKPAAVAKTLSQTHLKKPRKLFNENTSPNIVQLENSSDEENGAAAAPVRKRSVRKINAKPKSTKFQGVLDGRALQAANHRQ